MTRDETVALFLECEARRAEALAEALAEGKSERDAKNIAHEAAKKHWNAWAEDMLTKRKELEASGVWAAEKNSIGTLEPKNAETRAWTEEALAHFTRCLFLVGGDEGTEETPEEDKEQPPAGNFPVKSIAIDSMMFDFSGFVFPGAAYFGAAAFKGYAWFDNATFKGLARFADTAFKVNACFANATFEGTSWFVNATFKGDVWFEKAAFKGDARFDNAAFKGHASFAKDTFEQEAVFRAIRGERGLSMAGAMFDAVPDFIQAHFEEAPRLDNVEVKGQMLAAQEKEPEKNKMPMFGEAFDRAWQGISRWATGGVSKDSDLGDLPARWRALKRLAIQGHDTDRELAFFSGEVRSARFAGDWPLPWPIWKGSAWGGTLRFYAGWLYQIFSDFGRSLLRPFLAWVLCIVIFAVYFLGQNQDMAAKRRDLNPHGFIGRVIAYSTTAWNAASGETSIDCVSKTLPTGDPEKDSTNGFTGLAEPVRTRTNPVNEALSIAYHNALIVLDSSGDSAHRAFGCLYGVERYGGNPVAYVPRSVAIASGIQKLLSAIFIFLFGLGLRNMLKVK